jgi:hypothetical protein
MLNKREINAVVFWDITQWSLVFYHEDGASVTVKRWYVLDCTSSRLTRLQYDKSYNQNLKFVVPIMVEPLIITRSNKKFTERTATSFRLTLPLLANKHKIKQLGVSFAIVDVENYFLVNFAYLCFSVIPKTVHRASYLRR